VADIAKQGHPYGHSLTPEQWPAALVGVRGLFHLGLLAVWDHLLRVMWRTRAQCCSNHMNSGAFCALLNLPVLLSPLCRWSCASWSDTSATAPACASAARCRSASTSAPCWT